MPKRHAAEAGVLLLGQNVLLRGVNDSGGALEDLVRATDRARVRPYYVHVLDPAPGVARFSVPDADEVAPVGRLGGTCRASRFRGSCEGARRTVESRVL